MRVLVTGGSGRFGGYVLRELQRAGHTVCDYGRTPPPAGGVVFVEGDVGSLPDLIEALRDQDAVVHLAAVPHPRRASSEELMQVNVMGTFNILEAAVRVGIGKVVFASSGAAIGLTFQRHPMLPQYLPIDEDHPCAPQDEYGLSKLLGEIMCKRYADTYDMQTICIRINNCWYLDRLGAQIAGASGPMRMSPLPVETLWESYQRQIEHPEGPWPEPGPAVPKNNLFVVTDARDAAHAIRLAVENQTVQHGVFSTCADDTCSLLESRMLIREHYPGVPVRKDINGYATLVSHDKATSVLGYSPKYSWRRGEFQVWLEGRGVSVC